MTLIFLRKYVFFLFVTCALPAGALVMLLSEDYIIFKYVCLFILLHQQHNLAVFLGYLLQTTYAEKSKGEFD